jgi:hypothetical protein
VQSNNRDFFMFLYSQISLKFCIKMKKIAFAQKKQQIAS